MGSVDPQTFTCPVRINWKGVWQKATIAIGCWQNNISWQEGTVASLKGAGLVPYVHIYYTFGGLVWSVI